MLFLDEICNLCEIGKIILFIKSILNLVLFIVPMLLIIMLSLDFLKSVISNSEDDMRKNVSIAIKRLIAVVVLFLLPTIINITASILDYAGVKAGTYYKLATTENLSTDMFKELEKEYFKSTNIPENIKNQINNQGGNKIKVVSPTANFKLKNDFIVLAHIKKENNEPEKDGTNDHIINETIKILNNSNQELSPNNFTFTSENPGIATVTSSGKVTAKFGGTTNIIVTQKNNSNKSLKVKVTVVHSIYTKVKTRKELTVKDLKTGKSVTLPKGTKGVYNGVGEKITSCKYKNYIEGNTLKVGNNYYKVDVEDVKHYNYKIDEKVDKKTAEEFVNARGFKSKTNYLFWSNQGTEYEYIFTGSKGKWTLFKVFPISSGDILGYTQSDGNICSGTGIHPKKYKMGTEIHTTYGPNYFPHGYIPRNNNSSGYHEFGGTRYPKTHGCTAFKLKDLKWFTSNIKKIGKSQIITI